MIPDQNRNVDPGVGLRSIVFFFHNKVSQTGSGEESKLIHDFSKLPKSTNGIVAEEGKVRSEIRVKGQREVS